MGLAVVLILGVWLALLGFKHIFGPHFWHRVPRQAAGHPVVHGDFTVSVSGVLFLHGDRHDVTLGVAIHRNGDDFIAVTHLTIPYVRWGLKDPSLLFLTVSDEVTIDVSTVGHVTWIRLSN